MNSRRRADIVDQGTLAIDVLQDENAILRQALANIVTPASMGLYPGKAAVLMTVRAALAYRSPLREKLHV